LLNIHNIRYITVNQNEFERTYATLPSEVTGFLTTLLGPEARIYNANGLEIYRVPPSNSVEQLPIIIPTAGWYRLEKEAITKRWIGDKASISIYSFKDTTTTLSFEATAFNRLRHLTVTLNGQLIDTLEIQPDQMLPYQLKDLKLKNGENLLVLDPIEEPESPANVIPGSQDTRNLTIALRQVINAPSADLQQP
jgi:hypothetical protein